jgi:hypothetical protein
MKFKVLDHFVRSRNIAERVSLIIVFHVLDTSIHFIRELSKKFHVRLLIGIPYSANENAIEEIRNTCSIKKIVIPDSINEIQGVVKNEIVEINQNEKFIILEVGGYCSSLVNEIKSERKSFLGVVEDTNQGHWGASHLDISRNTQSI